MRACSDANRPAAVWPGGEIVPLPVQPHRRGFSAMDLHVLHHWCGTTFRASVWESEFGSTAMLRRSGVPWSAFALAREDGRVKLWDCVSLEDIGLFDTVRDALAAIPAWQGEFPAFASVVPFPTAHGQNWLKQAPSA